MGRGFREPTALRRRCTGQHGLPIASTRPWAPRPPTLPRETHPGTSLPGPKTPTAPGALQSSGGTHLGGPLMG